MWWFTLISTTIFMFLGVFLLVYIVRRSQTMLLKQDVSTKDRVIIPLISGISAGFMLVAIILLVSVLDKTYLWTPSAILGVVLIFLIVSCIVAFGAYYQFFIAGRIWKKISEKLIDRHSNNNYH